VRISTPLKHSQNGLLPPSKWKKSLEPLLTLSKTNIAPEIQERSRKVFDAQNAYLRRSSIGHHGSPEIWEVEPRASVAHLVLAQAARQNLRTFTLHSNVGINHLDTNPVQHGPNPTLCSR